MKLRALRELFDAKLLRYLLVGVANTAFGSAIMFGLHNLAGCGYWFSSAANYICGGILSYFLNKYFTFRRRTGSILLFAMGVAGSYLVAYGAARPLTRLLLAGLSQRTGENLAMLAGMAFYVGLNYLYQRWIVFRAPAAVREPRPDGVSILLLRPVSLTEASRTDALETLPSAHEVIAASGIAASPDNAPPFAKALQTGADSARYAVSVLPDGPELTGLEECLCRVQPGRAVLAVPERTDLPRLLRRAGLALLFGLHLPETRGLLCVSTQALLESAEALRRPDAPLLELLAVLSFRGIQVEAVPVAELRPRKTVFRPGFALSLFCRLYFSREYR